MSTNVSIKLTKKEEEIESWRTYVPAKNILEGEKRAYMEYKNLKKLGGTAVARVYRAERESRIVTLKLYVTTKIESTTKFTSEVKILQTIRHPNIIQLYDCWADNKYYYLEMEYCSGGDLWNLMQSNGRVSEIFARHVGYSLLDVLSTLHKMKYCHRDLKPENIVLVSKKSVLPDIRLIDFGEALQVSKDQLYVNTISNPCYFAPELWKSVITGKEFLKADVWSVGIIVLELLNGQRCFAPDLPHLLRIAVAQFVPKFSQTVSKECQSFVQSLTVADPTKRPSAYKAWSHPWMLQMSLAETDVNHDIIKEQKCLKKE